MIAARIGAFANVGLIFAVRATSSPMTGPVIPASRKSN